jgi:hypothetical protein
MSALNKALANTGARVAGVPVAPPLAPPPPAPTPAPTSREGTAIISVHLPTDVRRQLKALAGEQGRAVADVVAEALNLVFARYGKPEVAPTRRERK